MGKSHDRVRGSGLGASVGSQSGRRMDQKQDRVRFRVGVDEDVDERKGRQEEGRKDQEFGVWTLSLGFRSTARGPFGHTSPLRSRSQWRGQHQRALRSAQRQTRSSLFFSKEDHTNILSVTDSASTKANERTKRHALLLVASVEASAGTSEGSSREASLEEEEEEVAEEEGGGLREGLTKVRDSRGP